MACPTQWEGKLSSGKMFYLRYRWGYMSISVSKRKTNDVYKAVNGEEIYSKQIGGAFDGCLDDEEIEAILCEVFYV